MRLRAVRIEAVTMRESSLFSAIIATINSGESNEHFVITRSHLVNEIGATFRATRFGIIGSTPATTMMTACAITRLQRNSLGNGRSTF